MPNFLHFPYCRQVLEAGLNVIVEKPITSNAAEALKLKELAEQKHRFLFEAVTGRYDQFRAGETLPAFDPEKSGGALMDLNLYNLHFVMGLFGRPEDAVYYANIQRNIGTSGTMILRYPGFVASCIAAKDCTAPYSFVIQGTDGYITTQYSPNLIGEVTLHLHDNTEEHYDDGMAMNRLIPEFRYFIDCISRGDWNACMEQLEKSIAVSEIQTKARLACRILFAADRT